MSPPMERFRTVIVGAGVSGLATAAALSAAGDDDYVVLEADREIGGYCKTIKKDGFVWDYSGHFFHFKHAEIEAWLRARMPGQRVLEIAKRSFIAYAGRQIDFPFQKNIHQLPQDELIDCLHDLYFARAPGLAPPEADAGGTFKDMLYARFGRSIAEKFLVPYNEKLYACDLSLLDRDAMGRFFPHADLTDVIRNMRRPDNTSYNSTFTYPEGGAIEYVKALARGVEGGAIRTSSPVTAIDLSRRIATTPAGDVGFERLVSSAPFDRLLALARVPHDPSVFGWNKVLVYNLGFDKKGQEGVHWLYFPGRETCFYRVGFYDNIFHTDRLSVYVELGYAKDAAVDADAMLPVVLRDLAREGVISDHRLVASHSVVMDPAYVHITRASMAAFDALSADLAARGVFSIGRYGGWKYCSIEDNIVEARALVASFSVG